MTDSDKSMRAIGSHLEEIRELEGRLIHLKRQFLDQSTDFIEGLVDENGLIPFLITVANDQQFAIPVAVVEEVIEVIAITKVAEKRRGLLGVFNYHGKLTALFDLADVANVGKSRLDPENVIVICLVGDRMVGLLVTEATDVYMVEEKNIEISETVVPGGMRAIGMAKLSNTQTATIVDIWSTMLGVKPEKWHSDLPPSNASEGAEPDGANLSDE